LFPKFMVDEIIPDGAFEKRDLDQGMVRGYRLVLEPLHERGVLDLVRPKAAGQRAEKDEHQRQPAASRHRRFSLCNNGFWEGQTIVSLTQSVKSKMNSRSPFSVRKAFRER
jgi:hypothetical protein